LKRIAIAALLLLAVLAAHILYWYVPRERAEAPRLQARPGPRQRPPAHPGSPGQRAPGNASGGPAAGAPLQVLAAGDYDVCLWVPYPHQNLGALATAIGDLGDVVAAAARLTAGGGGDAEPRPREPEEAPTFGPFEVPPADEMVACSDLAGGRPRRLRVVARIYPVLAVVAKLAGRLAGNPWLAGGEAGPMRIAWSGRLWSVASGPEQPPARTATAVGTAGLGEAGTATPATAAGAAQLGEAGTATTATAAGAAQLGEVGTATTATAAGAAQLGEVGTATTATAAGAAGVAPAGGGAPELPESLAVVHWTGARPEIPAGYYALTRSGSDLAVSLITAGDAAGGAERARGDGRAENAAGARDGVGTGGARSPGASGGAGSSGASGGAGGARSPGDSIAGLSAAGGPLPSLLVAVGPEWRGAAPFGASPAAPPAAGSSPAGGAGAGGSAAAAAMRELPLPPAALALFETGGSRLSSLGDLPGLAVFNAGTSGATRWRLPTEGIFRLLAGRLPTAEAAGWKILALDQGSLRQAQALAPRLAVLVPPVPGGPALSMGLWLEPHSALRIVSRIRGFVEKFPLASRRQIELWRDWETVLDPLANCDHAALTATASPASMRLLLQNCTASVPH
jgi:hypothetical protein